MATAAKKTASTKDLRPSDADLEEQVKVLREDIHRLASTLGALGSRKYDDTKSKAMDSYEQAVAEGERALKEIQARAKNLESDLADKVREKPLQAMAIAAGVGFLFALFSRR